MIDNIIHPPEDSLHRPTPAPFSRRPEQKPSPTSQFAVAPIRDNHPGR